MNSGGLEGYTLHPQGRSRAAGRDTDVPQVHTPAEGPAVVLPSG